MFYYQSPLNVLSHWYVKQKLQKEEEEEEEEVKNIQLEYNNLRRGPRANVICFVFLEISRFPAL